MHRLSLLLLLLFCSPDANSAETIKLEYRPSPAANPLKGLVPYASETNIHFPHSMEFNYLGYSELVKGYDQFDWQPMEELLNDISGRGHQAVLRVFLEYPAKSGIIPQFLIDDGLRVHKYLNTNTHPFPPSKVETPDYDDVNLRRSLRNFIAEFGKRYDGDPRIGFITAGLLGTWGEWHTYPRDELFASKVVQAEVMDAYAGAFKVTPILLRYPAGDDTWGKASNAERPFGYHDDSFCWATLDTGKKQDNWFYVPALRAAGSAAMDKWKTFPIGGEIRPEAWGKVFDAEPGDSNIQDFRSCVVQTHASWLMDTGMFEKRPSKLRRQRAELEVSRMGYEFHVPEIAVAKERGSLKLAVKVENRGVAPFYYDWKTEYGLISDNIVVKQGLSTGKIVGLLPGDHDRQWFDEIDTAGLAKGKYVLGIRVVNPLANGLPLRFANATQDRDMEGWLSLTTIEL
jgi:hypothetical protein